MPEVIASNLLVILRQALDRTRYAVQESRQEMNKSPEDYESNKQFFHFRVGRMECLEEIIREIEVQQHARR